MRLKTPAILLGICLAAGIAIGIDVTTAAPAQRVVAAPSRARTGSLPTGDTTVYEVQTSVTMPDGEVSQRTEWIAEPSGSWRIENPEPAIYITDGVNGLYAVLDPTEGTTVRTGSSLLMGAIPNQAIAAPAISSYTNGTMAQRGVTATSTPSGTQLQWTDNQGHTDGALIQQTLAASSTQAQSLFSVPLSSVTATDRQQAVGQTPTNGTQGFWFGPSVNGANAVLTIERTNTSVASYPDTMDPTWPAKLYFTYYELPANASITGATPGQQESPDGEIRVVSEPRSLTLGQHTASALLNGVNGDETYTPWPSQSITLADGESATLVINRGDGPSIGDDGVTRWTEFWVITGSTLTAVDGWFTQAEITTLAPQLRPATGGTATGGCGAFDISCRTG